MDRELKREDAAAAASSFTGSMTLWEAAVGEAVAGGCCRQRPPSPAALSLRGAGHRTHVQRLCLSRWPSSLLPEGGNPTGPGS